MDAVVHGLLIGQQYNAKHLTEERIEHLPETEQGGHLRSTLDKFVTLLVSESHDAHGVGNLGRQQQVQGNLARDLDEEHDDLRVNLQIMALVGEHFP